MIAQIDFTQITLPQWAIGISLLSLTVSGITFVFGRDIRGQYKNRNAVDVGEFLIRLERYWTAVEKLHDHGFKHQSGQIETNAKKSREAFGRYKKEAGRLRLQVQSMLPEDQANCLAHVHSTWSDALYTDQSLCDRKDQTKNPGELELMEKTHNDLDLHVRRIRVKCQKREVAVKLTD
ncbi:hypothetical protein HW115_18285 [Verrucomicrobiaceae bacterium N1E253]|uniref:Uncharacterized protein n=1 Tax=Oceaniferula marina TaxID=2748318 RepID=A0A851GJ82_9BACT|nr:hypothetical protein [Oceaniferula marina]NWK57573.1 hypothetical protein [Oceaniferula marina]